MLSFYRMREDIRRVGAGSALTYGVINVPLLPAHRDLPRQVAQCPSIRRHCEEGRFFFGDLSAQFNPLPDFSPQST